MGKLRLLKVFLGLVNIFITLAHLQASPKLSNFGLYTAPEGQKTAKNAKPVWMKKGKMLFFANLDLDPGDLSKVLYDVLWVS